MRTALVKLSGKLSNLNAIITFQYNTFSSNTWTCFPNYMGVTDGTWVTNMDTIMLKDERGDWAGVLDMVNLPLLGYPFAGKKGQQGRASCWKKGAMFNHDIVRYEVLSE
jgi:hypothetical protein